MVGFSGQGWTPWPWITDSMILSPGLQQLLVCPYPAKRVQIFGPVREVKNGMETSESTPKNADTLAKK